MPNSAVQFDATMSVTGEIAPETKMHAVCLILIMAYASKLSKDALIDACDYTYDLYKSQIEMERIAADPPTRKRVGIAKIKYRGESTGGKRLEA